jgi:poly-gamma-glutamate synthase PgsB/CapB
METTVMMNNIIALCGMIFVAFLSWERVVSNRNRKKLQHVIHVNGTRGKSTTVRLITAGLQAGGWRVFCKTTGTAPMIIDSQNTQRPVLRRGQANIREQLSVMAKAVKDGAQVLVVECMAISPNLQYASQHKMLKADIGVITNVRRDHTDVMGESLEEICRSMCSTIPRKGTLFTGEKELFNRIKDFSEKMVTKAFGAWPSGDEPTWNFPENISLALAVCGHLNVEREIALKGMAGYQPDPYALSIWKLSNGALFVNGMSINDVDSATIVYNMITDQYASVIRYKVLLLNNRADRGFRTQDMLMLAWNLAPNEIWLLGSVRKLIARKIEKRMPNTLVRAFKNADAVDINGLCEGAFVFAAGNIAGPGKDLIERIKKESEQIVWRSRHPGYCC